MSEAGMALQERIDDEQAGEAPRPYRVLITGARDWPEGMSGHVYSVLFGALTTATRRGHPSMVVVHGDCPTGADAIAKAWAQSRVGVHLGVPVTEEAHPADWARHGTMAGPLRNAAMAKLGADECHGFITPTARGTWGCLKEAAKRNIPVFITQHFTA